MHCWAHQRTLERAVRISGMGLHTGATVTVDMKPAAKDTGIWFRRVDLPGEPTVPAHYEHVVDTSLATVIGNGAARVATIEHLMAALSMAGIDNLIVDVDGPEVPVLDGSAAPYFQRIEEAGVRDQRVSRRALKIASSCMVTDGDAYIRVSPGDSVTISYTIDFPHPMVGRQRYHWEMDPKRFSGQIAGARTFGFLKDVKMLQDRGLALGGSLRNALVFDDNALINMDGFRYQNECVRHKILDFIGDMALLPHPVIGHFEAYKAGHKLHNRLLHQIMQRPTSDHCLVPVSVRFPALPGGPFGGYPEPVLSGI